MSDDQINTAVDNIVPIKSTVTIFKYRIDPFSMDDSYVKMPEGAEIICAHGDFIWARVDTSKPEVERRIVVLCTGEPILPDEMGEHIATIFQGGQVRHLYDCGVTRHKGY
ncbi:hypothetical protein M0R72_00885 [Candidatus Pacearchaeota archaeon]|jgi:hypothetical protein|nr:hypothetical protein [Candidatus Pacearchaeota archaeon]